MADEAKSPATGDELEKEGMDAIIHSLESIAIASPARKEYKIVDAVEAKTFLEQIVKEATDKESEEEVEEEKVEEERVKDEKVKEKEVEEDEDVKEREQKKEEDKEQTKEEEVKREEEEESANNEEAREEQAKEEEVTVKKEEVEADDDDSRTLTGDSDNEETVIWKDGKKTEGFDDLMSIKSERLGKRVERSRGRPTPRKPEWRSSIPRDWEKFTKFGKVVAGTPFFPFKTPFYEEKFELNPTIEPHTVMSLIDELSSRGIRLAVVVDLTLPEFYDSALLSSFGIKYVKIACGHLEPKRWQVDKFLKECDDFMEVYAKKRTALAEQDRVRRAKGQPVQQRNLECIGVHCTRGVNRTGYFIVRAMVERMRCTTAEAIRRFNEARGHDMDEFGGELRRAEKAFKGRFFANRNKAVGESQRPQSRNNN